MTVRVDQCTIFDSTDWPKWLEDVGIRADELVADPIVQEHFWRMLGDWKIEHDRCKRGHVRYNAVEILPRRRLSLPDKFAAVAAIHDVICEKSKRIDPWGVHKRLRSIGVSRAKAGIAYGVLCHEICDISDNDRERIEQALSDVEADLASRFTDTTPTLPESVDHGGKDGEPPPANSGPKLNETDRKVRDCIMDNPGLTGKQVAARVSISPEHFRRIYSQKLKQYGFTHPGNGDGYFPPGSV